MHMARINIYVPDELAEEAKRSGLNVSSLAQRAIRASLAAQSTDQWLRTLRPAPPHTSTHESVVHALDAVRDEAPTRHG
jgi:post-segregation antitoxin (ccd killing protein)